MANLEVEANKKQRLIREGKRIQQSEPEPDNTELILKIFRGFVKDERVLTQLHEGPECYRVMAWIAADDEYGTQAVKGYKGFSNFNKQIVIPLDSPAEQYLYIELVRGVSWRDPGTWNGTVVMGRAKVKLPPWTSRVEFKPKVDLIGLNNDGWVVVKGFIELSMQLRRYDVNVIDFEPKSKKQTMM